MTAQPRHIKMNAATKEPMAMLAQAIKNADVQQFNVARSEQIFQLC